MINTGYANIAKFYDEVIGDSDEEIKYIKKILSKYHGKAKSVLELGCGTGNNLKALAENYKVCGVDNSPEMLKIAVRKVKEADFVKADIKNFSSEKSFDSVICVYDTINHLNLFSQWQSLFMNTFYNLNENGLFIFDINTLYKLDMMSEISPVINKFGGNYFIADVMNISRFTYNWNLKIFKLTRNNNYRLYETNIKETSFEIFRIVKDLSKKFEILKIEDGMSKKLNQKSERAYFICRKKNKFSY